MMCRPLFLRSHYGLIHSLSRHLARRILFASATRVHLISLITAILLAVRVMMLSLHSTFTMESSMSLGFTPSAASKAIRQTLFITTISRTSSAAWTTAPFRCEVSCQFLHFGGYLTRG